MNPDLLALAALLRQLRCTGRTIPVGAAEALVLIGAGVDSIPELQKAMGDGETPLAAATVSRLLSLLRGRARYDRGTWRESPYGSLVQVRRHPHRRGWQLLLSTEAQSLLNQYTGTSLLGVDACAPVENS